MATFDDYAKELQKGIKKLTQGFVDDLQTAAFSDANAFYKKSERDLARWTKRLEAGEITEEDFADLVEAKKSLAELHELTNAGLTITKLDRFRADLISLLINTATKVYL